MAWDDIAGFTIHKLNGAPHHLAIDMQRGRLDHRAELAARPAHRWWLLESATYIPRAQLSIPMEELVPHMSRFRKK